MSGSFLRPLNISLECLSVGRADKHLFRLPSQCLRNGVKLPPPSLYKTFIDACEFISTKAKKYCMARVQPSGIESNKKQRRINNEMLPFDYCCLSAKKELKRRTCEVCNQYIPSASRMKNYYKIHQEHYEVIIEANDSRWMNTEKATPVLKTEMLDWLRSDFDQVDSEASVSDRLIRSMQKLNVAEKSLEKDQDQDWVHLE